MDQACHQRVSATEGVSQLRTARSARGQLGAGGTLWHARGGWGQVAVPPLLRACRCRAWRGRAGEPAEREGAVDHYLVAADRDVGADLEIGPAQLVLDLLIRLLHPVPQPVDPGDLIQARGRSRAVLLARAAWPGQVRDQVPGGLVRQGTRVRGGCHQPPGAVRPPPAQRGVGRVPGLGVPVAEPPGRRLPVTRITGPPQASARAASTGVRASGP